MKFLVISARKKSKNYYKANSSEGRGINELEAKLTDSDVNSKAKREITLLIVKLICVSFLYKMILLFTNSFLNLRLYIEIYYF